MRDVIEVCDKIIEQNDDDDDDENDNDDSNDDSGCDCDDYLNFCIISIILLAVASIPSTPGMSVLCIANDTAR